MISSLRSTSRSPGNARNVRTVRNACHACTTVCHVRATCVLPVCQVRATCVPRACPCVSHLRCVTCVLSALRSVSLISLFYSLILFSYFSRRYAQFLLRASGSNASESSEEMARYRDVDPRGGLRVYSDPVYRWAASSADGRWESSGWALRG